MKNLSILLFLVLFCVAGCKNASQEQEHQATIPEKPIFSLTEIWATDTLMTTCESVIFDKERNVIYVSNINSGPADKDGNGFISKLSPDGEILSLKWITEISAPKGLGIDKGLLYVTDIDELVIIDIEEGEIIQKFPVEGSSFLNDLDIDSEGVIYITDSNTGKIHKYKNGEISDWITEGLKRPNGLFIEKDRILLTTSEGQVLRSIDPSTAEMKVLTSEIGRGDGVRFTGIEGYYLISDWSGEIFLIDPDYNKISLLNTKEQNKNTADFAFNMKEKVIYVPTFFDNRVVAYKLEIK
ncbi:MAG: hypothetical protein KAS71_00785 [Bacteroidales bacterium]|nr:hypothetical protein [Bacteroidales bacterium]